MDGGEEEAQLAADGDVVGDGGRSGEDGVRWGEEGVRSLLRCDGVAAFRPAHTEHREPVQDLSLTCYCYCPNTTIWFGFRVRMSFLNHKQSRQKNSCILHHIDHSFPNQSLKFEYHNRTSKMAFTVCATGFWKKAHYTKTN